ncbi:LOW QUALITY PROTEIN: mitochondrial import receptor subunit TOM34 [Pholidichthys leucotaenia]
MPHKQKSKSWMELKGAGNDCFRTGQYGDATNLYSQAIKELEKSGKKNSEDLGILYSNRAASFLKEGNCGECLKDCNKSLEFYPFNMKSLLVVPLPIEALERYGQAYVDYKSLQIDCNVAAAHDGTNRMMKALMETDGPSWREKLPPIPTVPLSVREMLSQKNGNNAPNLKQTNQPQQNGIKQKDKPAPSDSDIKKGRNLKEEGNTLVKKGEFRRAIEKYSESLKYDPGEVTTYTNRALCYLSVKQYEDAVRDCNKALNMDAVNVKALYRRAQAKKELKDLKSCLDDLNSLLKVEPKNSAALKLLKEVQKKK